MADFLAANADGTYTLIDWKCTQKDLSSGAKHCGHMLKGCMRGYADIDHNRYVGVDGPNAPHNDQ